MASYVVDEFMRRIVEEEVFAELLGTSQYFW